MGSAHPAPALRQGYQVGDSESRDSVVSNLVVEGLSGSMPKLSRGLNTVVVSDVEGSADHATCNRCSTSATNGLPQRASAAEVGYADENDRAGEPQGAPRDPFPVAAYSCAVGPNMRWSPSSRKRCVHGVSTRKVPVSFYSSSRRP
jgi:hypothetical protein